MDEQNQKRFDKLYEKHCNCLQLQGKAKKTIKLYSFALQRFTKFINRSPDTATKEDFQRYFKMILEKQSWSTVKVNRVGLMFFYRYVLEKDWPWVDIVKPPKVKSIPNYLTQTEVKTLLLKIRKMRYRVFFSLIFHGTSYKRRLTS